MLFTASEYDLRLGGLSELVTDLVCEVFESLLRLLSRLVRCALGVAVPL